MDEIPQILFEIRVLKIALCFLCACNLLQLLVMGKNQKSLF